VRVLLLLNAWLKPEEGGMEGVEGNRGDRDLVVSAGENREDALEPNWQVLNYWAMRLRPLWVKDGDEKPDALRQSGTSADMAHANDGREVIVVVCNRCGNERGA